MKQNHEQQLVFSLINQHNNKINNNYNYYNNIINIYLFKRGILLIITLSFSLSHHMTIFCHFQIFPTLPFLLSASLSLSLCLSSLTISPTTTPISPISPISPAIIHHSYHFSHCIDCPHHGGKGCVSPPLLPPPLPSTPPSDHPIISSPTYILETANWEKTTGPHRVDRCIGIIKLGITHQSAAFPTLPSPRLIFPPVNTITKYHQDPQSCHQHRPLSDETYTDSSARLAGIHVGPSVPPLPSADFGLIGLAVMGQNLILNAADHGFTVCAYNRTTSKVDRFLDNEAKGRSFHIIYGQRLTTRQTHRWRPLRRGVLLQAEASPSYHAPCHGW